MMMSSRGGADKPFSALSGPRDRRRRANCRARCQPALPVRVVQRDELVLRHVVRDALAERDALGLVECPVDSEVDAALAVLLFGLRERGEAAREQRPDVALIVDRRAVELVGREREGDVVTAVEVAQGLEERAAEAG